jgi:glyoxylase-like metal-dependent hydrolase (beta-lactamase superfamily II)
VIRYESALWETTALALHADGQAVLVDPCVSAPEIAAIAADVAARGLEVRGLLITHADWDHVCGISAFPGVPAIMSRGAADRIASGQAAEEVVRHGAEEGLSWDGSPRADHCPAIRPVAPATGSPISGSSSSATISRSSNSRSCMCRPRPTVPRLRHC